MANRLETFIQKHSWDTRFKTVVQEYGWAHLLIGLIGNVLFLIGSILFLPVFEPVKIIGIWIFILGAFLMAIGALGRLLVDLWHDAPLEAKQTAQTFAKRHDPTSNDG